MITLHYDGLGINATSGPLTGFRVAHVKSECHGFTEQERNELGRAMAAAPEMLEALRQFVSLCPSEEGLGGHAPIGAFFVTASKARAAIARATQP